MKPPVRLQELIGESVAKASVVLLPKLKLVDPKIVRINYLFGHYPDIRERLRAMVPTRPEEMYPLVALFEDFVVNNRKLGLFGVGNLKLLVLHKSDKAITREQRELKTFKPILIPIYDELLRQMKLSGNYMQYGPFPHRRIDRPHWGDPGLYANGSYLFDAVLDGIELADLELQVYKSKCITT